MCFSTSITQYWLHVFGFFVVELSCQKHKKFTIISQSFNSLVINYICVQHSRHVFKPMLHSVSAKGDVTIIMSDEDMFSLMTGKLNPQNVSL